MNASILIVALICVAYVYGENCTSSAQECTSFTCSPNFHKECVNMVCTCNPNQAVTCFSQSDCTNSDQLPNCNRNWHCVDNRCRCY
ncbi:serine protease inhibitor Cvsi-2-like [Ruditapes philippinarum]|uniref:serine protease inhibitor Cvsi-2-like n=1 Tax=Ruditapes philippinarum TaxID=129788 RepID=UPI00295B7A9E|nr:serine protease inhibitor Cvsi-2-like [Ruditapes philippinarum]